MLRYVNIRSRLYLNRGIITRLSRTNDDVNMRKYYTTEGDTTAKKAKNAYPKLALCEKCVGSYVVISEGERTYDECAKCGEDD